MGKNRLCVDAQFSGSITIGAVSLMGNPSMNPVDATASQQGTVGLHVVAYEPARSKVTVFGQAVVAAGNTLTLASYTVPPLQKFFWKGVLVGGGSEGEFDLQVSTITQAVIRNSGARRSIVVKFPEEPEASAGAVVSVEVTNVGDLAKPFEATIYGYTVTA